MLLALGESTGAVLHPYFLASVSKRSAIYFVFRRIYFPMNMDCWNEVFFDITKEY